MKGKLAVRALVLGGHTDGLASADDFERSKRKFVNGCCQVRMLPGGHFMHREHPDQVFEAIRLFLEG